MNPSTSFCENKERYLENSDSRFKSYEGGPKHKCLWLSIYVTNTISQIKLLKRKHIKQNGLFFMNRWNRFQNYLKY
jgi:hypothetical protein